MSFSDTELMKQTYASLILIVKELQWMLEWQKSLNVNNTELKHSRTRDALLTAREARNRQVEFDLMNAKAYINSMLSDAEYKESLMKEYGAVVSDVVSLDEFRRNHPRRKAGGGMPLEGDWLSDMVCGTEFLVRPKVQKTWILAKFMHAGLRAGCVLVIPMQGDEPIQDDKQWVWVDPAEFCKFWELRAILLIPEVPNE